MTRTNSRSSLFLMEIMLAILFFSIAGALSLNMFAKSHQMSEDTVNLSMASDYARNTAELLKHAVVSDAKSSGEDFFSECILEAYPNAAQEVFGIFVYFDQDWKECDKTRGMFCLEITPSKPKDTSLFCCNLSVVKTDGGSPVYSLDLKLHIPNQPN